MRISKSVLQHVVLFCVFFLQTSLLQAQVGEFSLSLDVSDGVSAVDLVIGASSEATNARDPGIDIAAPPLPPSGYFYSFIEGGGANLLHEFVHILTELGHSSDPVAEMNVPYLAYPTNITPGDYDYSVNTWRRLTERVISLAKQNQDLLHNP